jgi:hypothetical protein
MEDSSNEERELKSKQVTEVLVKRLNDVFQSMPPANRGQVPCDMYDQKRKAVRDAWMPTLADPVARRHVHLDAQWSVTKSTLEGHLSLLEILISLCVAESKDSTWTDVFDTACRADLLDNLRMHTYHDHAATSGYKKFWATSWRVSFATTSSERQPTANNNRHDLVRVCQSALISVLNAALHRDTCNLELAHFIIDVLDHALTHGQGCSVTQIDVRRLFWCIANSGPLLARLVELAHKHGLSIDQCGTSLASYMIRNASLGTLQTWASSQTWVDDALHSDWWQPQLQPSQLSTSISVHRGKSKLPTRQEHFFALRQRWLNHNRPTIIEELLAQLPFVLVQHVLLPYFDLVLP